MRRFRKTLRPVLFHLFLQVINRPRLLPSSPVARSRVPPRVAEYDMNPTNLGALRGGVRRRALKRVASGVHVLCCAVRIGVGTLRVPTKVSNLTLRAGSDPGGSLEPSLGGIRAKAAAARGGTYTRVPVLYTTLDGPDAHA